MAVRNVVILGGYGTFGRHISEDLVGLSDARVTIAGRNPGKGQSFATSLGVDYRQCDAKNATSLKNAIDGAWLVINASGPFNAKNYSIPRTCIEVGCHYIDMADGRDYVADIVQLDADARDRSVLVCAGASTTPAITSSLVAELQPKLGELRSIRVALNAGNKNQAGVSTIATILSYVGRPVEVWRDGGWRTMRGWSLREFVEFPRPVGRRCVQLCDVPDLTLFPQQFNVDHVTFKAGVELTILNYGIAAMALMKRVIPPIDLACFARPLVTLSGMFKSFGTLHGGCAVWVTDSSGVERSIALVAHDNGPRIPASASILLARKLLAGEIARVGAIPCMGLLNLTDFAEFLAPFNIFVVSGQDGIWAQ